MPDATSRVAPPLPPGVVAPPSVSWRHLDAHRRWLDAEVVRLLAFARGANHPHGGFGWLDAHGAVDPTRGVHTWITARMTHVHTLAWLRGIPGTAASIDRGLAALAGPLHDEVHGGWYAGLDADGVPTGRKEAYTHAFVVLAASSGVAAGRPGAAPLLDDALTVLVERFTEPDTGRLRESFARDFTDLDTYRGANSNMHAVEALLAAGDVTGERRWHDQALAIAGFLVDEVARAHRWRLVEHFDAAWTPVLDHHVDEPDHPFQPYGTTVGHWLEWSRLLLHLDAAHAEPPAWLVPAATALFRTAVTVGWQADGAPGFPYTLDFDDRPVVRARMHWVVAEAIAAAAALHERTGDPGYEAWYRAFWDHAADAFLDLDAGSWHHELTSDLEVAAGTWGGKPDLYHAVQAALLPQVGLAPALAVGLARGASAGA